MQRYNICRILAIFDFLMRVKVFYTKHLPVKGFRAINLFGLIFARKEHGPLCEDILNHESIHSRQIAELLVVGFYVWYITEWLIRWMQYKDRLLAYRNISFEREAFANDENKQYLKNRPLWAFIRYVNKSSYRNL